MTEEDLQREGDTQQMVEGRRGIYDFKVVCDESNNSPYDVDTGNFYVDISIKLSPDHVKFLYDKSVNSTMP